ncbi:MAG: hypothetical protein HY755_04160 [Nitrospirae bacterium]|nr:hypothetical protein [Nitrospirota bacterium]
MNAGFILKEDIIKVQHNCRATGFWVKKSKEYNFLLIMHEHVFVFKKTGFEGTMIRGASEGQL